MKLVINRIGYKVDRTARHSCCYYIMFPRDSYFRMVLWFHCSFLLCSLMFDGLISRFLVFERALKENYNSDSILLCQKIGVLRDIISKLINMDSYIG
jgi:hypothetical protein